MTLDPATFDRLATRSTRARLVKLTATDLDRAAVTTDWNIRTLLSHLVGGNIRFAAALRCEPVDWPSRDREPVATPLGEFDSTSALMAAAIDAVVDPRRPTLLPAGEPPAAFAIRVHAADMLVHGWDLAVATGQDRHLEPELCLAAIDVLERYPESFWGAGRIFVARVPTPSDDPVTRMLALSGRDVTAYP